MGLRPIPAGTTVVVCSTCRRSPEASDDQGRRDGARLAEALRHVRAHDPAYADIAVEEMPCLFACQQSCTVHLSSPGKVGYVMGRFEPRETAAQAILDYARAYAGSEWGQVPFRHWPEGIKGHLITRQPPMGWIVE